MVLVVFGQIGGCRQAEQQQITPAKEEEQVSAKNRVIFSSLLYFLVMLTIDFNQIEDTILSSMFLSDANYVTYINQM
jgi:hypothetical protein